MIHMILYVSMFFIHEKVGYATLLQETTKDKKIDKLFYFYWISHFFRHVSSFFIQTNNNFFFWFALAFLQKKNSSLSWIVVFYVTVHWHTAFYLDSGKYFLLLFYFENLSLNPNIYSFSYSRVYIYVYTLNCICDICALFVLFFINFTLYSRLFFTSISVWMYVIIFMIAVIFFCF